MTKKIETAFLFFTWAHTHIQYIRAHKIYILTAVSVIGHCDDTHWLLRDVGPQHLHLSTGEFVSSEHSPADPIGPEDVVTIDS